MGVSVLGGGEAQEGGAVGMGGGKGRSVDDTIELWELNGFHRDGGENMYIVGPVGSGVNGAGGPEIVIAWGDEHRDMDFRQGAGEGLDCLLIGLAGVQQVAGEQD